MLLYFYLIKDSFKQFIFIFKVNSIISLCSTNLDFLYNFTICSAEYLFVVSFIIITLIIMLHLLLSKNSCSFFHISTIAPNPLVLHGFQRPFVFKSIRITTFYCTSLRVTDRFRSVHAV